MNENKMESTINQNSLLIIGMIMIVVVIGSISTYAYVTWRGKESGGLITTIGDLATITFDSGVKLSSTNLTPVLNYQDGINTTFNIVKKLDKEVFIKVYLAINEIDENLKNNSLKYILLKSNDNDFFEVIASGDFSNIEHNNLSILESYELNTDITYYKLYIYIDGTQNNTNMINKTLDVTLNIGANKQKSKVSKGDTAEITSIISSSSMTSLESDSDIQEE